MGRSEPLPLRPRHRRSEVPAEALHDLFLNHPTQPFDRTFPWSASDTVLFDDTAPKLDQVVLKAGIPEVTFTEEPDAATLEALEIDGNPATWTLSGGRYSVVASTPLSAGSHTIAIGAGLEDLDGQALAIPWTSTFTVVAQETKEVFRTADPRIVPGSTIWNPFAFQGLPKDPESGLVYVRNRYYDPEMGRFVSVDPMAFGYVDGPNPYAFASNDPVNGSDPLGLYQADFHFAMTYFLALRAGFAPSVAREVAEGTERPDQDSRSPIWTGAKAKFLDIEEAQVRMKDWHFPRATIDSMEVVPGSADARKKVDEGLKLGDLKKFSEGLHPFEDSWSHRGKLSLGVGGGHSDERGGWRSVATDVPWKWPNHALEAAHETYLYLIRFAERHPKTAQASGKPANWSQVEQEVMEFIKFKEIGEKKAWLKKRSIVMPDKYWKEVAIGPVEAARRQEEERRQRWERTIY